MIPDATLEWLAGDGLDACELDDRKQVHEALARVPLSTRRRNPACLAVQAELDRLDGHVDAAVTLYERALALQMDPELEVRIREGLGHLFLSRRQDSECERVIMPARKLRPNDPRIRSLETVVRARRRDARAFDDMRLLEASLSGLSDLELARIYRRMAGAAYEASGDFSATERYWNLVIEHAEVAGAHSHAAVAYWALANLYSTHVGDTSRILQFIDLWTDAAGKAGDKGLIMASLVERYVFAAETGDKALIESLRARLRELHGSEKYAERIGLVLADAMSYGWAGAFDTMAEYLRSVNVGRIMNSQQTLYFAMSAIAHQGSGREDEALKIAYRALSDARPLAKEPLHETRMRLIARVLASAVLLRNDRRTEAARVLKGFEARMTRSLVCLRDAILESDYDRVRRRAPDVYGFALLCQALESSIERETRPRGVTLTEREIDVLRASSAGRSAKAIAEELEIAETTVNWHRKNVMKKLGVKSTLAAVSKGRELQLIP
jgi:DNA-binding CsgD family transcriptional regulator